MAHKQTPSKAKNIAAKTRAACNNLTAPQRSRLKAIALKRMMGAPNTLEVHIECDPAIATKSDLEALLDTPREAFIVIDGIELRVLMTSRESLPF